MKNTKNSSPGSFGLSRREFLKTAAAGAAGVAAMSALGGCATAGAAESAGAGQAGGRWSWSTAPAAIPDSQISQTLDCDVLVLGAGSAGMAAAVYASSTGAKTVVMTKGPTFEVLGFNVGAWNSKYDADFGIKYDALSWRKQFAEAYDGKCNVSMLGALFDKSGAAVDWLAEYMNDLMPYMRTSNTGLMTGSHEGAICVNYVWPDAEGFPQGGFESMEPGMVKFFRACQQRVTDKGGTFLFSTPAEQLIVSPEGKALGAIGRNKAGEYVKVNASKGVLIACGGIINSEEMMDCYSPMFAKVGSRNGFGSCTGDGIKMGLWAGAAVESAPWAMSQAYPHSDAITADPNAPIVNWFFASMPWLRVNTAGKRFVNEDTGRDPLWGSSTMLLANSIQPEQTCYAICDADYSALTDRDPRGLTGIFQAQAAAGIIVQGASLDELAGKIGVDAATLKATVDRYNGFCQSGADLEYGTDASALSPVQKAPFYALKFVPYNSCSVGGLMTNDDLQVLKAGSLADMEGLYAAGNSLGGRAGFLFIDTLVGSGSMKTAAFAGGILAVKHMLGKGNEAF
jgi:fumarate reductase flavoprotein subunit